MPNATHGFDSPWKDALDKLLKPFLAFFFPAIDTEINWRKGYQALDKEFQQIIKSARVGKRLADKLFKVWCKDGEEMWLLIHIEVQGTYEKAFAERMFIYNVLAYQLYNRAVVSLAVLTDERADWRPNQFEYGRWGSSTGIRFLTVKLLDYADDSETLEQSDNPFAAIVLAHLKAMDTRGKPEERSRWKVRLVKGLYERGWSAAQVRQLFRFIDWVMELPTEMQEEFRSAIFRHEEERQMPYLSSIERLALEEGREEGREEGLSEGREEGELETLRDVIATALEVKFGQPGLKLRSKIRSIRDAKKLRTLYRQILILDTLAEIRKRLE